MIIFDEAGELTPKMMRVVERYKRKRRSKGFGWTNWYVNRGRMSLPPTGKELHQVSWRRAK